MEHDHDDAGAPDANRIDVAIEELDLDAVEVRSDGHGGACSVSSNGSESGDAKLSGYCLLPPHQALSTCADRVLIGMVPEAPNCAS